MTLNHLGARDRAILAIALPSIVSNVTVPLLALVDTGIVGHLGSAAYIGAISVGGMIFNMIYWLFSFLRMGTGGLTAQAYGAGDAREAQLILRRSLLVAAAFSLLMIAGQRAISAAVLRCMTVSPDVATEALTYFSILIWGAPAVLGLYSFIGWFLGMQDARVPMMIAIVQNVVNIVVSLFLVMGLGWKVAGVATGTLVAQYAGCGIAIAVWWRRYGATAGRFGLRAVWHREAFVRFFSVNRDIFLRTLCLIAVTTYFTSAGAAAGDDTLAANTLLMQLFVIFSYIMDGFAYAGEALGGRCLGARDRSAFLATARRLFAWGVALALLFTVAYLTLGDRFISLLTDVPSVRRMAAAYLPLAWLIPLVSFSAFLFDGLFIGTTSTRGMLVSMAGAMAAFFVCRLCLPQLNWALWTAFLVYLGSRGLLQALLWRKVMRKFETEAGKKQ